ncbi:putative phosphoenolpyruvate synthase-like [Tropilaelaps mercedesae]|uniref:Putative phosphoenolpyruvate synthase-like n=1 Tax=Tropilaelaps mercedesae TaxID=418985 RepID=A0A1V9XSE7_9ACAR|nr:putative phosphoenolpyruvate synthase-like [Tropilaelaps mercedesae]
MAATARTVEPRDLEWWTYLRYLVVRVVLWLTRSSRRHRFANLYDLSSDDPFKYGALPTRHIYEAEWPAPWESLCKANDGAQFFCASACGQIMTLVLTRRADKRATVVLYLRTKQTSYVLPKEVQVDHSAQDTFAVDGLRIECVIPMRRWRVSFNGLLRNQKTGLEDHVRFVFTCNSVTNFADQGIFHSNRLLAVQLASSRMLSLTQVLRDPSSINRSLKEIDSIIQTYSFVGKISVKRAESTDVYEEEVFAFGHKKRCHEKISSSVNSRGALMGYTRNGIFVHLEELSVQDLIPALTSGVFVLPSFVHSPVENAALNLMQGDDLCRSFTLGCNKLTSMEMLLVEQLDSFTFSHEFNNETRQKTARVFKMTFDGREGYAVFFGALGLTGGKASSLAVLMTLAKECEKFEVAKGLAVTTAAYERFAKQPAVAEAITQLEDALRSQVQVGEVQKICDQAASVIGAAQLPPDVRVDLKEHLQKIFGADLNSYRFAVRSSAVGEDSEEMSAAGQMETFLGCRGFNEISSAVAKCWASQFSFVAVQYRRRYGQEINCKMSVCVQEMVASEVSGVMFTVDPVTANPKYITITANYGLGESVVSAAADPDTFVLEKANNLGVRFVSQTLGGKKLRTVMNDDGGTRDLDINDNEARQASTTPCLSEKQLMKLGESARLIELHYASQRDTEWAFAPGGQRLVFLQARPVTSIHQLDTEFEYYHESDEGVTSEYDCLSKANVGEVFGGSPSPLTLEVTFRCMVRLFKYLSMKLMGETIEETMFARDQFFFIQNTQCFFGTFSNMMDYSRDDALSRGFAISMCGRIIDDEVVKIGAENKRRYVFRDRRPGPLALMKDMWMAESILRRAEQFVQSTNISFDHCKTSREMLIHILSNPHMQEHALNGHSKQIFYGTIYNVLVLGMLSKAEGGWTQAVFSDFAKVVSSCNNLVSADVPLSLEKIANQAKKDYGEDFKTLSPKEALETLKNGGTETAKLFAEFLQEHGHRCINEFDLASRPWSMDPLPVVKTIQSMSGGLDITKREEVNVDELLDKMQIKLGPWKIRLLRFMIYRVRKGIANRERAKNNLIMSTHKYRLMFHALGNRLVSEGRLSDMDLIFYLLPSEIMQLIETRSPKIISRAINRKRNAARAAKDIYPEHTTGFPIKPINASPASPEIKGSRRMEGTPVSQGRTVGTCRVVVALDDAPQIQPGDILVTYATDIGWSPYFPLLSGIVTELGGLISHGAVVAREYGLPCIVAAHGATNMFRSGEKVILDGTKGFLQTVDEDETNE